MANPEQLEYLQDSADDWNIYRREHAITQPDLSEANLSAAELPGADLSGADLARADLRAIDLTNSVSKLAKLYALPIVLSTVNVKTRGNAPTIRQVAEVLAGIEDLDRTTINAWEDEEFVTAVKATGRKKLIMTALWTEACLSFPALDALREGYEVYLVVDAVGGTSVEAHRAALERLVQADAQPTSVVQLLCELQRDWARTETVQQVAEILFAIEGR